MNLEKIISEKRGSIIDVRTPEEFRGGHVAGSINIPLQQIQTRKDEIEKLPEPLIFCCASGGRSGQATQFFKQLGFECYNGGSWLDVNYLQSKIN